MKILKTSNTSVLTITNDLRWNTHISNICTKANRNLGLLSPRFERSSYIKEWCVQYGSSDWDPYTQKIKGVNLLLICRYFI